MNPNQPTIRGWKVMRHALAALVVPALTGVASAQQSDLAAGEELYVSQCKLCHGSVSATQTSHASPLPPTRWRVHLAMQQDARETRTDFLSQTGLLAAGQLAFAPPFGPNLRGVYGRPAGSVAGFQYSNTFTKTLKGMEWNDAALDVWITNPQAWVPGVYMFYKQPDPEIRRKIILYLKANP
jgi:cytochrome c